MSQQKQSNDYLDKLLSLWMAFIDKCLALVRRVKTAVQQIPFDRAGSKIKQGWQSFRAMCAKLWQKVRQIPFDQAGRKIKQGWRNFKVKCSENWQKAKPYFKDAKRLFRKIGSILKAIVHWIWRLRKVVMAIPVVWMAVKLALENMDRLPEMVGMDIQSTGEFAQMVSREVAVYGPLAITGFCLLLMFCSRKTLLPWLISIFSLVLPLLIYLTNFYA